MLFGSSSVSLCVPSWREGERVRPQANSPFSSYLVHVRHLHPGRRLSYSYYHHQFLCLVGLLTKLLWKHTLALHFVDFASFASKEKNLNILQLLSWRNREGFSTRFIWLQRSILLIIPVRLQFKIYLPWPLLPPESSPIQEIGHLQGHLKGRRDRDMSWVRVPGFFVFAEIISKDA